ncbi:MAG: hypothetical protein Kow00129_15370 [Thermoleophilia bacterium]
MKQYAILLDLTDETGNTYMQTAVGNHGFQLEFQIGNTDKHYRVDDELSFGDVAEAFEEYVQGNEAWFTRYSYRRLDSETWKPIGRRQRPKKRGKSASEVADHNHSIGELKVEGDIRNRLLDPKNRVTPREAAELAPMKPGLYAVFVDRPGSLPEPFGTELRRRGTDLVYLGRASRNIAKRLVEQDLRHLSPSTFFRTLGAVLGYRPPSGSLRGRSNQNNYKFSRADTERIVNWIDEHLVVSWIEVSAGALDDEEKSLVRSLGPLFNLTHNPTALEELKRIRRECRDIARGLHG